MPRKIARAKDLQKHNLLQMNHKIHKFHKDQRRIQLKEESERIN